MNENIIVIGASAGGVSALKQIVHELPADLNAAVFIVLHLGASARSVLQEVLQRETGLVVQQAIDGEPIRIGEIRVARPDYHLILEESSVRLTRGPRENRFRPAIDALFRSAAYTHGTKVIGVVLSGALDDGMSGLWWVKNRGGLALVQDPRDADFPSMPQSALSHVQADHVVPVSAMATLLSQLTRQEAEAESAPVSPQLHAEVRVAKEAAGLDEGIMAFGEFTPYTCPECHGVLVQLKEGAGPHFRCHTGHAYSIGTLLSEVTEFVEASLWNSIRAIEESAMLLNHMARHARESLGDNSFAALCDEKAKDTLLRANTLRHVAHEQQTLSHDNMADVERGSR